jgi:hypothetical protein
VVLADDEDGDTVTYEYAWYVNEVRQVATEASLDGAAYFDRGDVIRVDITPNDGTADGSDWQSASHEVQNSLPVLSSVALTPEAPLSDDTLTCTPGEATDDDSDEVTGHVYSWEVNGVMLKGPAEATLAASADDSDDSDGSGDTGSATGSGDTGSAGDSGSSTDTGDDSSETGGLYFESGDVVVCYAAPIDEVGETGEPVASNSVVIEAGEDDSDTGGEDTGSDPSSSDTSDPTYGAAHGANELGGWGCASMGALVPSVSFWGALIAVAWRRREQG